MILARIPNDWKLSKWKWTSPKPRNYDTQNILQSNRKPTDRHTDGLHNVPASHMSRSLREQRPSNKTTWKRSALTNYENKSSTRKSFHMFVPSKTPWVVQGEGTPTPYLTKMSKNSTRWWTLLICVDGRMGSRMWCVSLFLYLYDLRDWKIHQWFALAIIGYLSSHP